MFKTFIPSKILQPYIAFYYTIKCKKLDYNHKISEYALPSGYGHMGFHFSGLFHIIQKGKKQDLARFYGVGQQTHQYYINSDSELVDFYGVTFHPTALWHLFGLDMPSITDKAFASTALFSNNIEKFTKQFNEDQEPALKIKLIENLLLDEVLTVQPQLNVIDTAIQEINETYGCGSIGDLIDELGISERYFQKNFKKMVGITPSTYKRIVRFNCMFSQLKIDAPIDCKGLSAFYNYYDFPHFTKDFKKYCGTCPSEFHIEKFHFLQEVMASKALID
jgi:AraC-like DNA-binding protein